jgi:hypothetical protein
MSAVDLGTQKRFRSAEGMSGPFRVNRVTSSVRRSLPVYPRKRTSSDRPGWSVSCQEQTLSVRQLRPPAILSIRLSHSLLLVALQDPQGLWALRKDEAMQGIASLAWVTLIAMEKNKDRWQCPRIAFSLMHS